MIDTFFKAILGSRPDILSDGHKLAIAQEVERRLKSLPAETYQLIDNLVKQRVEEREKLYRRLAYVVSVVIVIVLFGFYKITAQNAAEKVSVMLAESEAAQKVEALKKFHQEGLEKLHVLILASNDATNRARELVGRLKELENIDNVLRYSADGNLYIRSVDGSIWLERRDGTGPKGSIALWLDGSSLTTSIGPNPYTERPVGGDSLPNRLPHWLNSK